MKFQGMARREKGSEKWPDCGRLSRLILLRREGRFSRNFRARTTNAACEFERPFKPVTQRKQR
jgi:hypothetical protein